MDNAEIKENMLSLSEENYKKFSSSLILEISEDKFLGIRLPKLRALAKKIAKKDPLGFIDTFPEEYFEDVMLKGFVIGEAEMPFSLRCELIEKHVPKINNWSLCDSFCSSLKFIRENEERFLSFLSPYLISRDEFKARFAFVCLLDYYNTKENTDKILKLISCNKADGFYAKTAKAWLISQIFAVSPCKVKKFLKSDALDDLTHQKAILKIRESRRIKEEEKDAVLKLKR